MFIEGNIILLVLFGCVCVYIYVFLWIWCIWDVFKFVLMHLHEQWACLRQFMTVVQKVWQSTVYVVPNCTVVCSTVYGCVLHYRWSGVASQTKVHLSQGGSWHAFHKPSQDLATRNNTFANFPFCKTLLLFGARWTLVETWNTTGCCCARSRRHGKQTNQKNMERRSKDVETPLWKICKLENEFVQGHTFPHKKCWLKCHLVRWLFWPCRSFLSRFCNDLRSASFVCVFLATATYFIVW